MTDPFTGELTTKALETIIDRLPIGAIVVDDDGIIQRFNRHEEQLSGLSRENAVGKSFFSEVAPCTNDIALGDRFREGLATGNLSLDFEFSFPFPYNRVPRDVRIRAVSVQTEPRGLHVVLIEDITSRRQLEQNNESMMQGLRSVIARARTDSEAEDLAAVGSRETQAVTLAATMKGFGDFACEVDPAELFRSVDRVMQRVVTILDARGGAIETIRGDGVTALFDVSGQDRRSWYDAIRAAAEIVELTRTSSSALPFAVGLAAGNVVSGPLGRPEYQLRATLGVPMEIARSLAHVGRPNEVLMEDSVLHAVEDVVGHELLRGIVVPGVAKHGLVHRLIEVRLP